MKRFFVICHNQKEVADQIIISPKIVVNLCVECIGKTGNTIGAVFASIKWWIDENDN